MIHFVIWNHTEGMVICVCVFCLIFFSLWSSACSSLGSPWWPQTCGDPLASAFLGMELKVWCGRLAWLWAWLLWFAVAIALRPTLLNKIPLWKCLPETCSLEIFIPLSGGGPRLKLSIFHCCYVVFCFSCASPALSIPQRCR